MPHRPDMLVRFWGVRGSIATPGPHTARYGGNTPCVEVQAGDRLIILDAGSGLRELGNALLASGRTPIEADIFFTHFHWDHIQGFPFFTPAFMPGNRFRVHGRHEGDYNVKKVLEGQMNDPNFPVPLSVMGSQLTFHAIEPGESFDVGPVHVRTTSLNHPGGCIGYRLEHNDASFVFATDTEHDPESDELDTNLVTLSGGADVLVYDATYTEEEYKAGRVGWGHSTYEHAIRIARAAKVRRLYLFHHDPTHNDAFLDQRLAEARACVAHQRELMVEMSREGETIYL